MAAVKDRGATVRLRDPGQRRQGQHLAGGDLPGARAAPARGDVADARAHRARSAQPRQPDRARRRPRRLQRQPEGRARASCCAVARALRHDRDPDAPGALQHPADDGRALRRPARRLGRELGRRVRRHGPRRRLASGSTRAWIQQLRGGPRHHRGRLGRRRPDRDGAHALLRARPTRSSRPPAPRRSSSAGSSAGTRRGRPAGRRRARLPLTRGRPADRLLRLRRHRRRLHLDPPLPEVAQVRLHPHLRQPLARDPQRSADPRRGDRRCCASAATRLRTPTSRRSATTSGSRTSASSRSPSASATPRSGRDATASG